MTNYQLDIWEEVEAAMAKAITYYKRQNKSIDFLSDLDDKLEIISQNPYSYQVRFRNVRSIKLKSFPYVILYQIDAQTIHIIDLVHSSSNWWNS